jgi:pilus assembly protein CpaB
MNKNVLIVLAGGFVVAILVAVLVQASLGGKKTDDNGPKAQVLVAAKNLSLGTNLTDADLKWQTWPGTPFQGAIVRKAEEKPTEALNGRLIQRVSEGQPVLRNAVFKEGRGNLVAASLGEGMRAISIKVKAEMMAGGFVKPGDYVDVILTYRVRVSGNTARAVAGYVNRYATETIVKNAKVVAVDQDAKSESDDKGKVGKTVTIEVPPEGAEKVALATEMGDVTLALRGLGDKEDTNKDATTTDVQLSNVMQTVANIAGSGTGGGAVRVYNGANMIEQSPRSTGGTQSSASGYEEISMDGDVFMNEQELRRMVMDALVEGGLTSDMQDDFREMIEDGLDEGEAE